eukprot:6455158-Amphidinium_carterae.1
MSLMGPPEPIPQEALHGPIGERNTSGYENSEYQQQLQTALRNSLNEQSGRTDPDHDVQPAPGAASTGIRDVRDNYELATRRPDPATMGRIPVTPEDIARAHHRAPGAIPTTPGRGPDSYQRVRRVFEDDGTQTEGTGQVDWRSFDTSKALRNLASTSARVRLLTLRRLHVRWHHPSIKQMTDVLTTAGAPQTALQEVPLISHSCQICRNWTRPGRRGQASTNVATNFNQEIQIDLMIYHSILENGTSHNILHIIDVATRYAQAVVLASKAERDLCEAISIHWIMIFGSPTLLTVDGEKGLHSLFTADWAEINGVNMRYKAPHQHAWIIERHNQTLRESLHCMESQCEAEGRHPAFPMMVSLAVHMKNVLTTHSGYSPQQAVLGRSSSILPQVSSEVSQDAASTQRLREIAVSSIVEATSRERVNRANRYPSTPTLTDSSYVNGDQVDIWFDPTNKDQPGWRGPARVVQCLPTDGIV